MKQEVLGGWFENLGEHTSQLMEGMEGAHCGFTEVHFNQSYCVSI